MQALFRFGLRCCYAIATLGMGVSAALHVIGWLPVRLPGSEYSFLLGVGFIVLFLPLVFTYATFPGVERIKAVGFFRPSIKARRQLYALVMQYVPRWAQVMYIVLFVYGWLYLIGCAVLSHGSPDMWQDPSGELRFMSAWGIGAYAAIWPVFGARLRVMALKEHNIPTSESSVDS